MPKQRNHCDDSEKNGSSLAAGVMGMSQDQANSTCNNPFRDVSITSGMQGLSLKAKSISDFKIAKREQPSCPPTPSFIPKPVPQTPPPFVQPASPLKSKRSRKSLSPQKNANTPGPFLNKYTNNPTPGWDTQGRLYDMEKSFEMFRDQMDSAHVERSTMQESMNLYKTRSKPQ